MPAYNAERFITEAIQSVIDQDYPHFELLVINDGSTDETTNQVRAFEDQRIRYFSQTNAGVSAARNKGLAEMRGDFFCFLDADDVMPPRSLTSRLALFLDSQVNYVDGSVCEIDANGEMLKSGYTPAFKGNPLSLLLRLDQRCFFGPTWMIRRKPRVHYHFDETLKYGEDLYFYISSVQKQGGEYTFTEEHVLCYRRSGFSAMSNLDGLANGYIQLFSKIKSLKGTGLSQSWYLRLRISRIMVLSFLSVGEVFKAIHWFFRFNIFK